MNDRRIVVTHALSKRYEEHLPGKTGDSGVTAKDNRKQQRDHDADTCKWRHLIANCFAKIKEFRGIATRYDKADCCYTANWFLVAVLIASR